MDRLPEFEMIADAVFVACGAFGVGVFGFIGGALFANSGKTRALTFPSTHVSFDKSLPDTGRLKFLDEVRGAVIDGRLSQANQLKNNGASDQPTKPGSNLED